MDLDEIQLLGKTRKYVLSNTKKVFKQLFKIPFKNMQEQGE